MILQTKQSNSLLLELKVSRYDLVRANLIRLLRQQFC